MKNVDSPQKYPNVLSLCSGYGGIEIGLQRVFGKIRVLAHVEIEVFAIANLVDKMESGKMDPAPIWTDLKTFRSGIFRGCVDILTAGYPCQPFSAAGKQRGTKDDRHLWPYVRKAIFGCRPDQVFLENVEGHINIGIEKVLKDLERMGYRIEVGIFSAIEVGAPHRRKRVFILGDFASHDKRRMPITTMHRERITIRGSSCALADSRSSRSEQPRAQQSKKPDIDVEKYENVSNSERAGSQRSGPKKQERRSEPVSFFRDWRTHPWPARPGERQHDWEEPRTLGNTDTDRFKKGI